MKTILSFTATLLCIFLMNNNAYTQVPGVTFYAQNHGTFKQDGGTASLTITRHQTDDPYGNSKQGIMVKASNAAEPVFYVRSSYNQPNKYIMDLNKSFAMVFTSDDTVEFQFPGNVGKFTRVDATTQPVTLNIHVPSVTYEKNIFVDSDNKIELRVWNQSTDVVASDKVKFSFSKRASITWWKGIKIMGASGNELGILEMQDSNNGPLTKTFNYSSFSGDYLVIEIWKAKAFGAHTFMEKLYIPLNECKGKEVKLYWVND